MTGYNEALMFAYFANGRDADAEQVRFAVSAGRDPREWTPLRDGKPILVSDVGERGARDPFLVRDSRTGRFHLLATDLRAVPDDDWDRAVRWGSRSILVWHSDDLVNWSGPSLVPVAPDNAGNAWAPKAVWSSAWETWVVFFASALYDEGDDRARAGYQRILMTTTDDFEHFSPAEVFLDRGHDVIDAAYLEFDGVTYRFSADALSAEPAEASQHVSQEAGTSPLDPDFSPVRQRVGAAEIVRGEGPAPFLDLGGDGAYLLIDEFELRGYQLFHAADPATGEWTRVPDAQLPREARHGSVLPITHEEQQRLLAAFSDAPAHVTITVDDNGPGTPINPDMWGVFFEDINSSADGGLYAELIRNRDFSFTDRDHPDWDALTGWSTRGAVIVDDRAGASGGRAVVVTGDDAPATLTNHGFGGISVRGRVDCDVTIVAQALTGHPQIEVRLVDEGGEPLADAVLALLQPGPERELTTSIRPLSDASTAALEIRVTGGSVRISWVSLFPRDTFRGTDNGMRADLAEAIAELRPRFVRFPGGCVAHGLGLDNVYRWKDTVGPVRRRRGDFNLWGYHQSMGLGYFEYFRFCEQLGAEPLPVVAAGVCCQNTPGGQAGYSSEQMDSYIRDVLDLIEYANGPVDSRWGAVRAAAGHPEPFGLRYLGIGNEDEQSVLFRDRFAKLLDAVRGRHPEITVVGTVGPFPSGSDYDEGWRIARELGVDMVDEHSYKSPKWYFEHLDRFDSYDRSGPAVYVGEYGSRGNTQLCALAEAAYMMAMERNGDIVRLASYAPLLAKIGDTQWEPDLVYFDNTTLHRTLNYHVQRMHAETPGTRALPVTLHGAPRWQRQLSDRVTLAVRAATGQLSVDAARLEHDGGRLDIPAATGTGRLRFPLDVRSADWTLALDARLDGGSDGFTVSFGDLESDYYFEWNFGTWQNRFLVLGTVADGLYDEWTEPLPYTFTDGKTYRLEIRVVARGQHITCLIDGEVVHEVTHPGDPEQRVSATAVVDDRTGTTIVKLVNATGSELQADVVLVSGAEPVERDVVTLSAPPDAGWPRQEAPREPVAQRRGGGALSVPPFSFTTVRLLPTC
ncbi:alpha-L-arabinofuranosidase C-terminal domain-containing protein [Leifsonia sp. 1010]|uniref:alpha-L-arabinofuranosidase C-terminal domain-containing protein n=1 Tax=Leifsonia sp. 1010 TaxID=2817769 RepID=UPI0028662C9B|nr:alpha-L-arabinofuranosidase C-terminal domain-containing protein [Leifsonia sp. 1010]MDR6611177.1 alpha-L-arabinofuranosidase [Leifsonia sp. 1010]